jgi:hypothetical protein
MVSIGGNRAFRISLYEALVARCCARARTNPTRADGGADELEATATARLLAFILFLDLLCAAMLQYALHGGDLRQAFAPARFSFAGLSDVRL